MSEKDKGNLLAILESCSKITKFIVDIDDSQSFYEDDKTFDAVLINFVVIGEAVKRLSEELREKQKHIPWLKIKGFRNLVAHDYFGVDAEEVWQIMESDLPELEKQIKNMLE